MAVASTNRPRCTGGGRSARWIPAASRSSRTPFGALALMVTPEIFHGPRRPTYKTSTRQWVTMTLRQEMASQAGPCRPTRNQAGPRMPARAVT